MMDRPDERAQTRLLVWRTGRWIVGLFWLVQFGALTVVGFVEGGDLAVRLLAPRALIVGCGVLLTMPIVEVAARSAGSFRRRICLTVATALLMCAALMALDYGVYYVGAFAGRVAFDAAEFVYVGLGWCWFFLGVAGAVVGLCYSVEERDSERRLAAMETVARDARLAALRYQLNPHFLFNTLNSIAALVAERDNDRAEAMVESLSDFLRATLDLDPVEDVSLAQEVHLQGLYLSIEQIRFPDRLRVVYDVTPEARGVRVPALITQPIVENVIRHSVSRAMSPVTLSIAASVVADDLRLVIEDDGPAGAEDGPNAEGVGMGNVRARLESRYGRRQSLRVDRLPSLFRVAIELPAVVAS